MKQQYKIGDALGIQISTAERPRYERTSHGIFKRIEPPSMIERARRAATPKGPAVLGPTMAEVIADREAKSMEEKGLGEGDVGEGSTTGGCATDRLPNSSVR